MVKKRSFGDKAKSTRKQNASSSLITIATSNIFCYCCPMEKLRPHFSLHEVIQLAANKESVIFTTEARKGAAALSMAIDDIFSVLTTLTMRDFYKSMTSYADHTCWQDVYRPLFRGTPLYLKFAVIPEHNLLVVSFKRR